MSHLRGKRHMEALRNHFDGKEPSREQSESSNLKFIRTGIDGMPTLESEKEKRAKLLKKRAKKLKTKMASTPEASAPAFHLPPGRHRIVRIIQDLERDPSAFERHWNELIRLLEKGSATEQLILSSQRGLPVVTNFLNAWMDGGSPVSSIRLVASALNVVRLAARCNPQTSAYIVNSRVAPLLLCLLTQRLEVPPSHSHPFQSISIHFNPFQSISIHFNPLQSTSIHFNPFSLVPSHPSIHRCRSM